MLRPPPPVVCFFGPYDKQTRAEMKMFETRKMGTWIIYNMRLKLKLRFCAAEFISGSSSHILNAGAPVWGIDWCPIHVDDRQGSSHISYDNFSQYISGSN